MPAPQASVMQNLAKLKFKSSAIRLPTGWDDPEHQLQYDTPSPGDLPAMASALFIPAKPSIKEHVKTVKTVSKLFEDYIDGICSAICSAWSTWQSGATLISVMVNAVTASMGVVTGPPMTPLILAQGPKGTPQETKYTKTIASVIGTAWQTFTLTIKVPGMPWYPAFAAFPSAVAPPMPNIPCPVAALTQVDASIQAETLKSQMVGELGDPTALHHKELFGAISDAFNKCYMTWKVSTMVTNVLGTGPIPTFAPPFVPVGPVVMGMGMMSPGGFV